MAGRRAPGCGEPARASLGHAIARRGARQVLAGAAGAPGVCDTGDWGTRSEVKVCVERSRRVTMGRPSRGAPVAPGGPARRKQSRGRGSRRRDWTHTRVGTRPASPGGVPWARRGGPASAQRGRGSQAAAAGGPVMGNPPALPGPGDRLWVPTPATPSPRDEDSLGKGKPQRHSSWGQSRHHTHSLRHAPAPPQNRVARGSHYRALHKPLARPCTLRHTCVSLPTYGGDLEDTLSWVVRIMTALLLMQPALQATGANGHDARCCLRPVSACWAPGVGRRRWTHG